MNKKQKSAEEAEKIVSQTLSEWGKERKKYYIPPKEYIILKEAGGTEKENRDNKDGTYYYEIEFQNNTFMTCSTEKF